MRECWGANVPMGEETSFPRAIRLAEGEVVVLSWIAFPDKATHDACMASMETDPRWQAFSPPNLPFDTRRMIYGTFETVFEGG